MSKRKDTKIETTKDRNIMEIPTWNVERLRHKGKLDRI